MKDKMRNICKKEILEMDRLKRANLLTSLSGIKAPLGISAFHGTTIVMISSDGIAVAMLSAKKLLQPMLFTTKPPGEESNDLLRA